MKNILLWMSVISVSFSAVALDEEIAKRLDKLSDENFEGYLVLANGSAISVKDWTQVTRSSKPMLPRIVADTAQDTTQPDDAPLALEQTPLETEVLVETIVPEIVVIHETVPALLPVVPAKKDDQLSHEQSVQKNKLRAIDEATNKIIDVMDQSYIAEHLSIEDLQTKIIALNKSIETTKTKIKLALHRALKFIGEAWDDQGQRIYNDPVDYTDGDIDFDPKDLDQPKIENKTISMPSVYINRHKSTITIISLKNQLAFDKNELARAMSLSTLKEAKKALEQTALKANISVQLAANEARKKIEDNSYRAALQKEADETVPQIIKVIEELVKRGNETPRDALEIPFNETDDLDKFKEEYVQILLDQKNREQMENLQLACGLFPYERDTWADLTVLKYRRSLALLRLYVFNRTGKTLEEVLKKAAEDHIMETSKIRS